jgi:E3 ubiquitin ligase
MRGHDENIVPFLLIAAAAGAIWSFWSAYKNWRENRLVADLPTSRVRSAAQGYVELTGHGVMLPDKTLLAPLTRKPCTWWHYSIEDTKSKSRAVDRASSEAPFLLDDGTGRCLIDPRGAQVFAQAKDVWYGATEWPSLRLPAGEGLLGKLTDLLFSGGRYKYTETRLQPNETVCAVGAFRTLGGANVEDPEAAVAVLLHDWKLDQKTLLQRFDRNHDGVLGAEEWEQARAAARRQVAEHMVVEPRAGELPVLSQPADGRAFLLSASDGTALARRLRRNSGALLALGVCLSALLTWMFNFV